MNGGVDERWAASVGAGNSDALLGLLLPAWRLTIGLFVMFALLVAGIRLLRRGRSRMTNAVLYLAVAIVCLVILAAVVTPA